MRKHKEQDIKSIFREGQFIYHRDSKKKVTAIVVKMPHGLGPCFLITGSDFMMFAEDHQPMEPTETLQCRQGLSTKSMQCRLGTVVEYLSTLALLNKAGIVSDAFLEQEVKIIRAFVMSLVGLDGTLDKPTGSLRYARLNASPKDSFSKPGLKGVSTTTKRIGRGIGSIEGIWLRYDLGERLFSVFVSAFGFNPDPEFRTPMDNVRYIGFVGIGDQLASPCPTDVTATICTGVNTESWALPMTFVCQSCKSGVRSR